MNTSNPINQLQRNGTADMAPPLHPPYFIFDTKLIQWRFLNLIDYFTPVGFLLFQLISMLLGVIGAYLVLCHLPLPKGSLRSLIRVTAISDLILILLFSISVVQLIAAIAQEGEFDHGTEAPQKVGATPIFYIEFCLTIIQDFFRHFSVVIPIAIVYHQCQIVVREKAISSIRTFPTLVYCVVGTLTLSLVNIPFYLQSFGNYVYADDYKILSFCRSVFFLVYFLAFLSFYLFISHSLLKMKKFGRSKKSSATLDLMQNLASAITLANLLFMVPQLVEYFAADSFAHNGIFDSNAFYIGQVSTALRIFANTSKGFFHALAVMYARFRFDQAVGQDRDIHFGQKLYRTIFAKRLQEDIQDLECESGSHDLKDPNPSPDNPIPSKLINFNFVIDHAMVFQAQSEFRSSAMKTQEIRIAEGGSNSTIPDSVCPRIAGAGAAAISENFSENFIDDFSPKRSSDDAKSLGQFNNSFMKGSLFN